jgi:hypothetical protein
MVFGKNISYNTAYQIRPFRGKQSVPLRFWLLRGLLSAEAVGPDNKLKIKNKKLKLRKGLFNNISIILSYNP